MASPPQCIMSVNGLRVSAIHFSMPRHHITARARGTEEHDTEHRDGARREHGTEHRGARHAMANGARRTCAYLVVDVYCTCNLLRLCGRSSHGGCRRGCSAQGRWVAPFPVLLAHGNVPIAAPCRLLDWVAFGAFKQPHSTNAAAMSQDNQASRCFYGRTSDSTR